MHSDASTLQSCIAYVNMCCKQSTIHIIVCTCQKGHSLKHAQCSSSITVLCCELLLIWPCLYLLSAYTSCCWLIHSVLAVYCCISGQCLYRARQACVLLTQGDPPTSCRPLLFDVSAVVAFDHTLECNLFDASLPFDKEGVYQSNEEQVSLQLLCTTLCSCMFAECRYCHAL